MVDDQEKSRLKEWDSFVHSQEERIGKETVDRWLKSFKIVDFDAANLYLEGLDAFHLAWFEEHMRYQVRKHLKTSSGRLIKVHLSLAASPEKNPSPLKKEWIPKVSFASDPLDPYATFDHYISDEATKDPLTLLQQSLKAFNPIYIFGPKGSGKTHLLGACAHALAPLKIVFVKAETFTSHVIAAIRNSSMGPFRQFYRQAEALLVDDIHHFAHKTSTQEEFFHTFNALHSRGIPIILTGTHPPHLLQGIESRLTSRFEWGIALSFQPTQSRRKLLLSRAEALGVDLDPQIQDFLLEAFQSHPSTLIQALELIVLRSHLEKTEMTLTKAQSLLAPLIAEEIKSRLSPLKIIEATAAHFGMTKEEILSKAQTKECVVPRQIAMYLCREKLKLPYLKIGEIFKRDHSTVMSSIRGAEGKKKNLLPILDEICRKLMP